MGRRKKVVVQELNNNSNDNNMIVCDTNSNNNTSNNGNNNTSNNGNNNTSNNSNNNNSNNNTSNNSNNNTSNNSNNEVEVVVKKKRGRKPKNRTPEEIAAVNELNKNKIIKKRGRRPKEKYNFDTNPLTQNFNNENENIIIKLPVKTSDVECLVQNNITSYNPTMTTPLPYDPVIGLSEVMPYNIAINTKNEKEDKADKADKVDKVNKVDKVDNINNISKNKKMDKENEVSNDIKNGEVINIRKDDIIIGEEKHKNVYKREDNINIENDIPMINEGKRQIDVILNNKYQKGNNLDLLVQFAHVTSNENYPSKTNVSCFWCAHTFDTIPWGIPLSYENEVFDLYGVFCSPNCACALLFAEEKFRDKLWEIYSLLCLFYYKIYNKMKIIYPSPERLCLQKFGGKMSYYDFRRKNDESESVYILKFPPVISVIPVIEEVNLKKIQVNNDFIPVDKSRMIKANQDLRLKRGKPINSKNTLDNCLGTILKGSK